MFCIFLFLKKTAANYRLAFISKDNLLQNILGKIKKPNKVRQYRKSLIYVFASFLSVIAKNLFLQGRLDSRQCPM